MMNEIPLTDEIKKTIIGAIDTKLNMVASAMEMDDFDGADLGAMMTLGGQLHLAKITVEKMSTWK
jgi:hypothetical protein